MLSPQTIYLLFVSIVTVVSIVYRYKKNMTSEYKSMTGVLSITSQILCTIITYLFLTGLNNNGYGFIAWLIVLIYACIVAYGIKYMISDMSNNNRK